MRSVTIVGEHPTRHTGFATVGRQIARSLSARGIRVHFLAWGPPLPGAPAEPYEVLDADEHLVRPFGAAVAHRSDHRLLLSIGGLRQHETMHTLLTDAGNRDQATVIAYVPVDHAPLPPGVGEVLEQVDVVVPYTSFGAEAVRRLGVRGVAAPIPHGVDTQVFRPLGAAARAAVRREQFGISGDEFLVGYFGHNCGHKRPDLALRAFAAWVRGDATASRSARLYLHTPLLTARQRRVSGGWDLERLARRLGVLDRVLFDRSLQPEHGVTTEQLARRMAACDFHLLLYEGGGWELTVLETAACGVPNVITDTAGPPEYAAPFSVLVPPAERIDGPHGVRAIADIGRAAAALDRLADAPSQRQRLGRRAIEVARAHDWRQVATQWHQLLQECSTDTSVPA